MEIQDLSSVKLSEATRGYLTIYLKMCDLYGDLSDASSYDANPLVVDSINAACNDAISKAQDEVMKLVVDSIKSHLFILSNSTEL